MSDISEQRLDEKRRQLAALLRGRSKQGGDAAAVPSPVAAPPVSLEVPESFRQQRERFLGMGISLPFFRSLNGCSSPVCSMEGRPAVNFSCYNYLGLADDPRVCAAAQAAIDTYGTSVSASRVASGERPFHRSLERRLAALTGSEDALVFVSGFGTNETVISHLLGPGDLVVHDALIHSSALQGALASGARRMDFRHNDLGDLEQVLRRNRSQYHQCLVVVEGLYSMDGDIPELSALLELKRRHGVALMVDEAHSVGVLGEHGLGLAEFSGVDGKAVDLWMGTLSKSLASCGGYIAGSAALIEYLRYSVPGFVYSVGISPPNAAAAMAALEILQQEPERVASLHRNAQLFLDVARGLGLKTGLEQAYSVVPVMVGESETTVRISALLMDQGFNVQPAIFPAVPEGQARLRFFVTSAHTPAQIRDVLARTAELMAQLVAD